jgi:predicted small lipoprotein YifL
MRVRRSYCDTFTKGLTTPAALANAVSMQKNIFAAVSVAALLSLAACGQKEPEVVDLNPDPDAAALAKAAPVEAPPMIQASRTYRCKDNSLVYVDFYTNNTAQYRTEKGGQATTLTAAEAGQPYTAEGYSVSANAAQINLTAPGKGTLSCKA